MMQYIDTHCHIHCIDYPVDGAEIVQNAAQAGVGKIITMGCDVADSERAVSYAKKHNTSNVAIYCGVGIFPSYGENATLSDIEALKRLVQENPSEIKAIGEIGIDHHDDDHHLDATRQMALLEAQLQLAVDLYLPVSLHVRSGQFGDAFSDLWAVLGNFTGANIVRGVLHSFTDSLENLDKCLSYGLSIGVNGIVTFNRDEELDEVYRTIPQERIISETDSPYLAPKPYRGKVNQPACILNIVKALAAKRETNANALATACYNNASDLFGLRSGDSDR
jgi:TatD DNase family protein